MQARHAPTRLHAAPAWFRAARALVRRLPAGRFVAFKALADRTVEPFEDRLAPSAGGARYRCDLRHIIARETCLTGRYSPLETALLQSLLAPGDTFVDVGANFGYFTLVAAAATGGGGRVIALEPDPRMASELRLNVALNALPHVTVLQVAASDDAGTATLHGYDEQGGNWGVSALAADPAVAATSFDVECGRLDDLLDRAGVTTAALVKIDVEGAEARVLDGMSAGIGAGRYHRILVEFHPWLHPDFTGMMTALAARMADAGYEGVLVDETDARTAMYGGTRPPVLRPLVIEDCGEWPHVLWSRRP